MSRRIYTINVYISTDLCVRDVDLEAVTWEHAGIPVDVPYGEPDRRHDPLTLKARLPPHTAGNPLMGGHPLPQGQVKKTSDPQHLFPIAVVFMQETVFPARGTTGYKDTHNDEDDDFELKYSTIHTHVARWEVRASFRELW